MDKESAMMAVTDHMYNPVPCGVQELKLGRAKIIDAGIAELQQALPNCKFRK